MRLNLATNKRVPATTPAGRKLFKAQQLAKRRAAAAYSLKHLSKYTIAEKPKKTIAKEKMPAMAKGTPARPPAHLCPPLHVPVPLQFIALSSTTGRKIVRRALDENECKHVAYALAKKNKKELFVPHGGMFPINITGAMLQCLRDGGQLDDEIINHFFDLLKTRKEDPTYANHSHPPQWSTFLNRCCSHTGFQLPLLPHALLRSAHRTDRR